jgi:hypothetical protein
VTLTNEDTTLVLQDCIFDSSYIKVGDTLEIKVDIPYGVSQARRNDITAHHHEEAMCGNI